LQSNGEGGESYRAAEIAAGIDRDGHKGAYWRLLHRADIPNIVARWASGEVIRGTTPEELALAASEALADLVFAMAVNVHRNQMGNYAERILEDAVKGVPAADIAGLYDCIAQVKTMKTRTALHRSRLRIVKE